MFFRFVCRVVFAGLGANQQKQNENQNEKQNDKTPFIFSPSSIGCAVLLGRKHTALQSWYVL